MDSYQITENATTQAYLVGQTMTAPYVGQSISYYPVRGIGLANVTNQIIYAGKITNVWPDNYVDIYTKSMNGGVPFLVKRLPYFDANMSTGMSGFGGFAIDPTNPPPMPPPAPTLQPVQIDAWPDPTNPPANPADSTPGLPVGTSFS